MHHYHGMPLLEDQTASFIVRIWREGSDLEPDASEWRGSIEHVQSGERVFFRELDAIAEFMKPRLQQIGIDGPMRFWERIAPTMLDADVETMFDAEAEEPPPPAADRVKRK